MRKNGMNKASIALTRTVRTLRHFGLAALLAVGATSSAQAQTADTLPVAYKGGSNYLWYRVDIWQNPKTGETECNREPYSIIKNYDTTAIGTTQSVRSVVQGQLAQMAATGQRALRLGLFLSGVPDNGTPVHLPPGQRLPARYLNNLAAFLADIRAAGFDYVEMALFPIFHDYDPSSWPDAWESNPDYEKRYVTYRNSLYDLRHVVASSGLSYAMDLGNEILSTSSPNQVRFATRLWREYKTAYGSADSVGFSFYLVRNGGLATQALDNLQTVYASGWPAGLDVHLYDYDKASEGQLLAMLSTKLGQLGQNTIPITVGEVMYNDASSANSLASTAATISQPMRALIQWPKSRTGSQHQSCDGQNVQAPMTGWSRYKAAGF